MLAHTATSNITNFKNVKLFGELVRLLSSVDCIGSSICTL